MATQSATSFTNKNELKIEIISKDNERGGVVLVHDTYFQVRPIAAERTNWELLAFYF